MVALAFWAKESKKAWGKTTVGKIFANGRQYTYAVITSLQHISMYTVSTPNPVSQLSE